MSSKLGINTQSLVFARSWRLGPHPHCTVKDRKHKQVRLTGRVASCLQVAILAALRSLQHVVVGGATRGGSVCEAIWPSL